MKKNVTLAAAALVAATSMLPTAASAQTSEKWEFLASLYGYFPTIGGKTGFPERNGGSSASVDADTILKNLEFVFMGSFAAQKGRWGAFTDVIYMDVGNTKSDTREFSVGGIGLPADASASVRYDLTGWGWTIAGYYNLASDPAFTFDVLGGARLLDIEQKINWQLSGNIDGIPSNGHQGNSDANLSNWDAIIGLKGRYKFGEGRRWYVPYYVDVGTGESDLTWQAVAGLGYSFHWGELFANWRYLDYNFKSGDKIEDLHFSGPSIGVNFRW